jgi:hypothetical protein
MPMLETLVWVEEQDNEIEGPSDPRRMFLRRLPSTLSKLQLLRGTLENNPYPFFEVILEELNIKFLLLKDWSYGFVEDVLHTLIIKEVDQQAQIFPNLQSISIRFETDSLTRNFRPFGFDILLQMAESRLLYWIQRPFLAPPFRLEVHTQINQLEWPPEFKEKIKELVMQGLDLEIMEGSTFPDWL